MRVTNHLRLLKNPDKGDFKTFEQIEKLVDKWISTDATATLFTAEVLQIFHKAFQIDATKFIKNIFFPNQLTLRATYARQDYALSQFNKAKKTAKLESRQIALENVYRSLVADVFDPYLSVLVACIQLKEGSFQSFELANLEKGEFNKYEFLKKRLKPNGLLKGYFPIIRNAVSHSGSHGITRKDDHITFKHIKRGNQPGISDTKTVTTAELTNYIQDLIDFVAAVETAINIIGLDMKAHIIKTPEIAREFQSLITQKQLAARRRKKDQAYKKVWNNNKLSPDARREYFIRLFAQSCQKNEMPATTILFKEEFVIVRIPSRQLDGKEDKYLINRVAELINYLLLAEMFFHFRFSDFLVEEIQEAEQQSLQLWLKAPDLKAYNIGEAHILDLMHDGKLYRNKEHQPIIVNFNQLDRDDSRSLKFTRKRKKR